jgi:hypothetical protein
MLGDMARDLQVTKPRMKGPDVTKVQERLHVLGYDVGKRDGTYGTTTEKAVRAFQKDRSLTVDGVVGKDTRKALVAKPPPIVDSSVVAGQAPNGVDPCSATLAVQRALSIVGKGGQYILGTGNYRKSASPDVPWTSRDGKRGADCAGFAMAWCYCIVRSRKGFNRGSWATVSDDINTDSGVEDAANKQELYRFVEDEPPAIGDLIVFPSKFAKTGKRITPGHVGIITGTPRMKWSAGWTAYGELDIAQCKGPNFRAPGVIASDGKLWVDHDKRVRATQPHRKTRILRINR